MFLICCSLGELGLMVCGYKSVKILLSPYFGLTILERGV